MANESVMHVHLDLDDRTVQAVRETVRSEIAQALGALARAAGELDMPYETSELESRAYQAGGEIARQALTSLQVCWDKGHVFTDIWSRPIESCRRCGAPQPEPVNPFEEQGNG